MAATTMQQAERSPVPDPCADVSSKAGTPAAADASSKADTPAADNTTGLDSTPSKALSRSQNQKRILLISACLAIVVVAVAISLGVHFGMRRNNNDLSADNNDSSTVSSTDPSKFPRDLKLKNAFYGVAYSLRNSHEPNCNQTLADTILDMQLLSQITTRLRLHSSECNQTALVLEAIKQTKTNLKIFPAIYTLNFDSYGHARQVRALKEALQTYGTSNVLGITVDYTIDNRNGDTDMYFPETEGSLDIREILSSINVRLPVGSASGIPFGGNLNGSVFGMVNARAWQYNISIQDAAKWTFDYFNETGVTFARFLKYQPQIYMAEAGWPTNSSSSVVNPSAASVENLQLFINSFVCTANTQGIKYFFFEYMDIPWKQNLYPGVGGFWGLFNVDRTLKAITLPDCAHV